MHINDLELNAYKRPRTQYINKTMTSMHINDLELNAYNDHELNTYI